MRNDSPVALTDWSLLDRLTGGQNPEAIGGNVADASGRKVTRRQRAKQMANVRGQIKRDLLALLGTRRLPADVQITRWPVAESSVVNYGIPDVTGMTSSSINPRELERVIKKVVRTFEPRLHPESVNVTCRVNTQLAKDVRVEIEGLFGSDDAMESFSLSVSICLGSGQCFEVTD